MRQAHSAKDSRPAAGRKGPSKSAEGVAFLEAEFAKRQQRKARAAEREQRKKRKALRELAHAPSILVLVLLVRPQLGDGCHRVV
jgi:hypothetical protein